MSADLDHVHRRTPLSTAPGRGRLLVPASVVQATAESLEGSGGPDGPHEGLVFWAGWHDAGDTIIGFAVTPRSEHGWGHVHADERAMLAAARAARRFGAGLLAQVHSHPGRDVRHSDGDDRLVHMPFEGMWSIVVGSYGSGLRSPETIGLHQYQNARWVAVEDADAVLLVLPPSVIT